MHEFELLSRASGFLVKGAKGPGPHIVASAHVIHPFHYPQYYPREEYEWLYYLSEDHIKTAFEVRAVDGSVLLSKDLRKDVFRHPARDFAVLHFEDFEEVAEGLRELGRGPNLVELEVDETRLKGANTDFVGHFLVSGDNPQQIQVPQIVSGQVLGLTADRQAAFASTEILLEMGMCGGPVLDPQGSCVGATEGIVSKGGPEPLRGCAALIPARVISQFLVEVEKQWV